MEHRVRIADCEFRRKVSGVRKIEVRFVENVEEL